MKNNFCFPFNDPECIRECFAPLPTRWGPWVVQGKSPRRFLVYKPRTGPKYQYKINVDGIRSDKDTIDWLSHMSEKEWMSYADLGALVRAFVDLGKIGPRA